MVVVTDAWKAAHKQRLLPETFIEISYAVTEPGLQQDAVSKANMEMIYSMSESLILTFTVNREKYSSLEHNFWGLDGSFTYFDRVPANPGYVTSTLSGEDGSFTALPTITITLLSLHTVLIPGITISWSETFGEWATRFRVSAYNGSAKVAERLVEGNSSPLSQIWMDLQNYDKLVIEVLSWSHPQHRARVARVFLGIRTLYTKDDLLG